MVCVPDTLRALVQSRGVVVDERVLEAREEMQGVRCSSMFVCAGEWRKVAYSMSVTRRSIVTGDLHRFWCGRTQGSSISSYEQRISRHLV